MSKSLARVRNALEQAGLPAAIEDMGDTRTAADAATAVGCDVAQIVKSIIFRGGSNGHVVLFLTSGSRRVDADKASAVAGQPLGKADAALIRAETGFAIGGVSPVGHLKPVQTWIDPSLLDHPVLYAAAGTPRHLFAIAPADLLRVTGATPADFTA